MAHALQSYYNPYGGSKSFGSTRNIRSGSDVLHEIPKARRQGPEPFVRAVGFESTPRVLKKNS